MKKVRSRDLRQLHRKVTFGLALEKEKCFLTPILMRAYYGIFSRDTVKDIQPPQNRLVRF